MVERLSAHDAILWHLEKTTAMHTLKLAVVDTSRRGTPLSLGDVHKAVEANIDRYPRARQKVVAPRGFGARPFWVEDDALDVGRHVDERTVEAPGGRREFDTLLGDIAGQRVPLDRPVWHVTLVHGLEGGRQALVARIHHAITDGSAAAASFEGLTTAEPGEDPEMQPLPKGAPPPRSLASTAAAEIPRWLFLVPRVVLEGVAGSRRAKTFRTNAEHLPPAGASAYRDTFLWIPSITDRRLCATASLPLADFQTVGRRSGNTVNGVLHAVLAGALRAERLRRGEDPSRPVIAAFGIALDDPEAPRRRWGNNVTPTYVALHTGETDPLERLRRTAGSAREGVELRRAVGPDVTARIGDLLPRVPSLFIRTAKDHIPPAAHLVTANVRGPAKTRWLGDCEVVDWYSFAVATPPLPLNVTVYSYAGEMNVGVLTVPEQFDDPHTLTDAMAASLAELVAETS